MPRPRLGYGTVHLFTGDTTLNGKVGFIDRTANFAIAPIFDKAWWFKPGLGRTFNDPCCGSGRMLLAMAKLKPYGRFVGPAEGQQVVAMDVGAAR